MFYNIVLSFFKLKVNFLFISKYAQYLYKLGASVEKQKKKREENEKELSLEMFNIISFLDKILN